MWELNREIDRGAVLSAIVLAAYGEEEKRQIEINDLSKILANLIMNKIIDLSDFSISPGGAYSEDITRFIGNNIVAGYAKKRSPLIFTDEGINKCKKRLRVARRTEKGREEVEKLFNQLKIRIELGDEEI